MLQPNVTLKEHWQAFESLQNYISFNSELSTLSTCKILKLEN